MDSSKIHRRSAGERRKRERGKLCAGADFGTESANSWCMSQLSLQTIRSECSRLLCRLAESLLFLFRHYVPAFSSDGEGEIIKQLLVVGTGRDALRAAENSLRVDGKLRSSRLWSPARVDCAARLPRRANRQIGRASC